MPYRLANPLAWRIVEEQLFAITPDGMLHVVEEPPGVFTFLRIAKQEATYQQLLDAWLEEFDVERPQAQNDLSEFLATMVAKKLLVLTSPPSD